MHRQGYVTSHALNHRDFMEVPVIGIPDLYDGGTDQGQSFWN